MSLPIYLVHNNLNWGRLFFYTNSGFSQIWYDQIQRFFKFIWTKVQFHSLMTNPEYELQNQQLHDEK